MLLGNIGGRHDPLLSFNFVVSLVGSSSTVALAQAINPAAVSEQAAGGFNECSGLEMNLEVEEYQEGGLNGYVHKFPTRVTWSNITLKKGLIAGQTDLWDWLFGFTEGRVQRRDGIIALLDNSRQPGAIWYFRRGLPAKYAAPPLNAQQNNVAVASIEIVHEGVFQLAI